MTRVIRKYTEMIALLSRRQFAEAVDEELTKVLETLESLPENVAGKASLTVTVAFKHELGRIDILPSFKVKLPETAKFGGTPFWMLEGGLSTQHPSQADMFSEPRAVGKFTDIDTETQAS